MIERTLVVLKPDAVERRLCGQILSMFEESSMRVIAGRIFMPTRELLDRHYPKSRAYIESLGHKSLNNFAQNGMDIKAVMGTDDPFEIGGRIRGWLIEYFTEGRVFAMVLEGNNAIKMARKICGPTMPMDAAPGTIRGRFAVDGADLANSENRSLRNLIHASGDLDEAKYEIELWFGKDYDRA
ncbi:MAG: hypothetical protein LBL52_04545 [Rickettsiales bacterium]|jgi:nucleoside-diphosphate kinase|nr:hypothetical protein [Rickettsiales bacterium]